MKKIERIIHNWLKILELENYTVHCFIRNPNEVKGFRKDDTAMIDIALGDQVEPISQHITVLRYREKPLLGDDFSILAYPRESPKLLND